MGKYFSITFRQTRTEILLKATLNHKQTELSIELFSRVDYALTWLTVHSVDFFTGMQEAYCTYRTLLISQNRTANNFCRFKTYSQ